MAIQRTYQGTVSGWDRAMNYQGQPEQHWMIKLEIPGVTGQVPVPVAITDPAEIVPLFGKRIKITCPNAARYSEKQRQMYVRDEPGYIGQADPEEKSNWGATAEIKTPGRPQQAAATAK